MGSYSDPADGVVMIPTRLRFADVETELAFRIRFGCEPGSGGFT